MLLNNCAYCKRLLQDRLVMTPSRRSLIPCLQVQICKLRSKRGRADQVCRTSACLTARRLTPQPFHPRPLGDLSIGPRRPASLPSQSSRAHLVASLSLVPPLVLICALPAEIWRRRLSRRRPEAPRAPWARAAGGLRHLLAAERADPRLPCPVAAPYAEAMLPWPLGLMARQLVPTPWPPDRSVMAPRSMADVAGMPRAS